MVSVTVVCGGGVGGWGGGGVGWVVGGGGGVGGEGAISDPKNFVAVFSVILGG